MSMSSFLLGLIATGLCATGMSAQGNCDSPAMGPDVIVGDVSGVSNWGASGGVSAFSLGTTSCNVGMSELMWISGSNQHPVIGQNMYRLEEGRFEQIGLSWLKHGFFALQGTLCCDCTPSSTGARLGVGCSDPYGSGLNGSQSGLGPRFEVNAHTGQFSYPFTAQGQSGGDTFKRLQVANADLDPALHPTALYYGEGHYITPDDAAAGNGNNNVSYRRMLVSSFTGTSASMTMSGVTQREQPAIMAWKANDPAVRIENVQVRDEGLFVVGSNATDNGDGTWHYEYAIHNINCHAGAGSFSIPLPAGANVTNIGFHDVEYHSGEIQDGTDWIGTRDGTGVRWDTAQDHATNPDANALRWGTLYNFRFDADVSPSIGEANLGLFAPHAPDHAVVDVYMPLCAAIMATETVRLGTPPNPAALLPGVTSRPVTGSTWDPAIDHTSFFPTATVDFLFVNLNGLQVNGSTAFGTLLCQVPNASFVFLNNSPGAPFQLAIPDDCAFVGRNVCVQGGSFGAGTVELANALDVVVGNL